MKYMLIEIDGTNVHCRAKGTKEDLEVIRKTLQSWLQSDANPHYQDLRWEIIPE